METRLPDPIDPERNLDGSWRGNVKMKRVRNYSDTKSIRDRVARAESEEELVAWGQLCYSLVAEGKLSQGTFKKVKKAGAARLEYLQRRAALTTGVLPEPVKAGENVSPGGIILP